MSTWLQTGCILDYSTSFSYKFTVQIWIQLFLQFTISIQLVGATWYSVDLNRLELEQQTASSANRLAGLAQEGNGSVNLKTTWLYHLFLSFRFYVTQGNFPLLWLPAKLLIRGDHKGSWGGMKFQTVFNSLPLGPFKHEKYLGLWFNETCWFRI